ncbi:MAG: TraB/GumN family protein [Gammaproteobacteria bacterium]
MPGLSPLRWLLAGLLLFAWSGHPATALECAPLASGTPAAFGEVGHGQGLLWRLTAPSGAESYLLGTMHVSDARVVAITEAARPYFDDARTFVMEVVLDFAALAELQGAMFLGEGRKLDELVGEAFFARLAAAMQVRGVPPQLTATMKPWAVYSALSLPATEQGVPLDMVFMLEAQAAGKAVSGLETVAEQIAVFEGVDEDTQLGLLREMACHYAVFQGEIEAMVEAYAARDLAALVEISFRHASDDGQALLDALLWSRNERMLERLDTRLAAGDAFVAVGALHLPGSRGLLRGLEQRGFAVEAIY